MTQDDIIEMARQTQMPFYWRTGEITYLDKLESFAKLVAAKEREACASMLEDWGKHAWNPWDCANAIRARGEA
jgi:hypothetical protein